MKDDMYHYRAEPIEGRTFATEQEARLFAVRNGYDIHGLSLAVSPSGSGDAFRLRGPAGAHMWVRV